MVVSPYILKSLLYTLGLVLKMVGQGFRRTRKKEYVKYRLWKLTPTPIPAKLKVELKICNI